MSQLLIEKLRGAAVLITQTQSGVSPVVVARLLREAADRIAHLEQPERVIELASATGCSTAQVIDIMNALGIDVPGRKGLGGV